MRKIFWENPYQRILFTVVSKVTDNEILLNSTIAYSFSGGQESDKAAVNNIPVINSRMDGPNIYYTLPDGHGLLENDKVQMEIDWPRRNRLMRLHFACELILVIVNRLFGGKKDGEELRPEEIDNVGIQKTGAHMSEDKARIDFRLDENISTHFPAILSEYKRVIDANYPIETGYTDEASQRRYWRIAGLATVPCGGTHVRSTAEVGEVTIKRERASKGVERIKITLVNGSPTSGPFEP